ncbi:DUF2993 domain-containing protein [Streptomyces sp. NPDC048663]|uniref:LmeA family phospholipid-binding protein n=1 Tax=Streptomyces sp. NPDC048663 TaxID=3155638 RepID=UPI00342C07CD
MTGRTGGAASRAVRGTAPGRTAGPGPRRRPHGRRILVSAVVLAALLAGTAELVARGMVDGRISGRLRTRIGANQVHLGGSALLGLARGRFDRVRVTGSDARLGRITGASVDLRLTDVTVRGAPRVGRLRGRITVPADAVARSLERDARGPAVSGVAADPAHGTLVISVRGGLGTVTVRPSLRDGRTAFELVDARVLGQPAPAGLAAAIEEALRERSARQPGPGPMEVTALEVTSAGLVGTVRADDVDFGRSAG